MDRYCDPVAVQATGATAVIDEAPPAHAEHWLTTIEGREPSPDLRTDAWLAALAQATDCEMTTFDKGFRSFPKLKLRLLSAADGPLAMPFQNFDFPRRQITGNGGPDFDTSKAHF